MRLIACSGYRLETAAQLIALGLLESGRPGSGRRAVEVDDSTYWLTRGEGYIINRKPTVDAGWDE